MEINELIHREGMERLREAQAMCMSSRVSHRGLAEGYRKRIDAVNTANAAGRHGQGHGGRATI